MAGRMRWTPTGLVIVGTWAHVTGGDAIIATAALGEFSCSEEPTPPHNRHTISHPAGLWMGSSLRNKKGRAFWASRCTWPGPHHRTERYPCRTLPPHNTRISRFHFPPFSPFLAILRCGTISAPLLWTLVVAQDDARGHLRCRGGGKQMDSFIQPNFEVRLGCELRVPRGGAELEVGT